MVEVVAALIWQSDKFMICQRPAHKARGLLWEFVGGKVESGETKEQALIRECKEELAVTLSVGDVFMSVVHEYPDLTVHLTLFNAIIAEGEPQKLEHNDIQWITPIERERAIDKHTHHGGNYVYQRNGNKACRAVLLESVHTVLPYLSIILARISSSAGQNSYF